MSDGELNEQQVLRTHIRELSILALHTALQLALLAVVCFLTTAIVIFALNR